MVAIPQYNQNKVNVDRTPTEYYRANANPDAFGASIAQANQKLGDASMFFFDSMVKMKKSIDQTRALELSNYIDKLEREDLSDPNNGYYSKLGKDAMADPEDPTKGANAVLNSIEQKINKKQQELGLSWGYGYKMAELVKTKKMEQIYRGASKHEIDETKQWAAVTRQEAIESSISKGILHRNNEEDLETIIGNGRAAVLNTAQLSHWDADTTRVALGQYESKFHASIIKAYAEDGSLQATEYYNKHKDQLLPEEQDKCLALANNTETKVLSKSLADNLFALYPEDEEAAIAALDKKDLPIDKYDATYQRLTTNYSRKRRIEEQEQKTIIDNFYDVAAKKMKNGEVISIDDIPEGLDGENYIKARNAIDSLNSTGDINTEVDTKTSLWYTANYDADRFKTMDLSLYRLSLSKKDYEDLKTRQQDIQKGDYFTSMADTKAVDNYIDQITGIKGHDKELFSTYQSMVRSHEKRTGRAATDIEKEQFLRYLGSNKSNYKTISKGMKENADFYKDLFNKINYYRGRHNDELPPEEMVNKWIKEQAAQYTSKKYNDLKNKAIQNTQKRPNEQLTLTNFADNYVPRLSENIGAKLNVTSRYRANNGKYNSMHAEGRALDIGYITKDGKRLTQEQKINLVGEVLKRPDVEKIAISSADPAGKAIIKEYGKKYKYKIQDMNAKDKNGKTRDQNLNTNHTNHIHITLYRDNTYGGNDKIAMRNQLKIRLQNAGYSTAQINQFIAAKGF